MFGHIAGAAEFKPVRDGDSECLQNFGYHMPKPRTSLQFRNGMAQATAHFCSSRDSTRPRHQPKITNMPKRKIPDTDLEVEAEVEDDVEIDGLQTSFDNLCFGGGSRLPRARTGQHMTSAKVRNTGLVRRTSSTRP